MVKCKNKHKRSPFNELNCKNTNYFIENTVLTLSCHFYTFRSKIMICKCHCIKSKIEILLIKATHL